MLDMLRTPIAVPVPAPRLSHPELPEGFWWACGFPERRDDDHACYSDLCVACWLALEAMLRTVDLDEQMWWRDTAAATPRPVLSAEARLLNLRRLAQAGVLRPQDEDLVLR